MPELVIYLLEGRSVEDKRALVKDLTSAVVKNLSVPQEFGYNLAGGNRADRQRQRRRLVRRYEAPLVAFALRASGRRRTRFGLPERSTGLRVCRECGAQFPCCSAV